MIITGIQNYINQKSNRIPTVKNIRMQSFTSDIRLNRDVFIPHDDNNVTRQYFSTYEPGKNRNTYNVNFKDYERAIDELNSDIRLDYKWVQNNAGLIKKVFGMTLPENSPISELFISELNSNRAKVTQSIINMFRQDLEQFYKREFPKVHAKPMIKNFNQDELKAYNLAMNRLDYDGTIPENIPLVYRTTTPLPDVKYLQKHTNARIVDARNGFIEKSLYEDFEHEHIMDMIHIAKHNYKKTGKRSIILISNLYNKELDAKNNALYLKGKMITGDNKYAAILVTEDILPRVKYRTPVSKPDFANIPAYEEDKQKFISTIIKPIKNNDTDSPQVVIFNSKTTPKDTREFLLAGLNEIDSNISTLNSAENINDFNKIITGIKEKAQAAGKPTFIVIPQAYKYISANPGNIELLKSLHNSNGVKIVPVLCSSYPEKIVEKMQMENISERFTLNKLSMTELENVLKMYVGNADDEINDLITSGREIKAPDKNIDYKNLAEMLNRSHYNGCKDIQDIVEKAKNAYFSSQKQSLKDYISEFISGGLNYEN